MVNEKWSTRAKSAERIANLEVPISSSADFQGRDLSKTLWKIVGNN